MPDSVFCWDIWFPERKTLLPVLPLRPHVQINTRKRRRLCNHNTGWRQGYQVCYEMDTPDTLERETASLWEVMKEYEVCTSQIITFNTEQIFTNGDFKIEIIPVWKVLLQ